MKRLVPLIAFAAVNATGAVVNPVQAGDVDPSIHKLCVEAKDYAG